MAITDFLAASDITSAINACKGQEMVVFGVWIKAVTGSCHSLTFIAHVTQNRLDLIRFICASVFSKGFLQPKDVFQKSGVIEENSSGDWEGL